MKKETTRKTKRKQKEPETIRERVQRHLSDINSVITDEDIRSVQTEMEIRGETSPENDANPTEDLNGDEFAARKKNNSEGNI